jgi:hypothetical protein
LLVTDFCGTLAAGDSFQLFQAGSFSGGFTNLILSGTIVGTNQT